MQPWTGGLHGGQTAGVVVVVVAVVAAGVVVVVVDFVMVGQSRLVVSRSDGSSSSDTLGVVPDVLVQPPLVGVPLPLHHLQLHPHPLPGPGQVPVVGLQVLSLDQSLGPAVLSVAAVLESPPLLLQFDDVLSGEAVESLVELSDAERDQLRELQ